MNFFPSMCEIINYIQLLLPCIPPNPTGEGEK
jgi:hypothetical protein